MNQIYVNSVTKLSLVQCDPNFYLNFFFTEILNIALKNSQKTKKNLNPFL